jgi:hypothetical protein
MPDMPKLEWVFQEERGEVNAAAFALHFSERRPTETEEQSSGVPGHREFCKMNMFSMSPSSISVV